MRRHSDLRCARGRFGPRMPVCWRPCRGSGLGAKLLVRPGHAAQGSLGNDDLDRVVERDALGELAAGRTGIRHYGPEGQARETTYPSSSRALRRRRRW